jgi:hypothetical protein
MIANLIWGAFAFHDEMLPQEGAKTPHFSSMKISEDVPNYTAEQRILRTRSIGIRNAEKSEEFAERAEIYAKVLIGRLPLLKIRDPSRLNLILLI